MTWAVFLAVLFPWISPVAIGPSPAVVPLIVTSAAVLVLWVVTSPPAADREPRRLVAALAVGGLALLVGGQEGTALAVGLLTLLLTYFSAAARPDPELVRSVMGAWLVAALVSVGIGLAQYFGVAQHLLPFVDVSSPGVAYGNLRQRNQFASLTMIGLAVLPWLAARGLHARWLVLMAVVLAVGNAASGSRTGVLQLVLLWGVVAVWERSVRSRAALPMGVAVLAYAVAVVALPWLSKVWAENTWVPLGARVVVVGLTVTSAVGPGFTTTSAVARSPPAETCTVPVKVPAPVPAVNTPLEASMLPPPWITDQVGVTPSTLPLESRAVAVKVWVPPMSKVALVGLMVSEAAGTSTAPKL